MAALFYTYKKIYTYIERDKKKNILLFIFAIHQLCLISVGDFI